MKKKIMVFWCLLLISFLLPMAAEAEPAPSQDSWFYGQIYVDNIRMTSAYATAEDGYAYVDENGRLMISLRGTIDMLDIPLQWDAAKKQVIIPESKNGRILFQLDSKEYWVNGQKKEMDTQPVMIEPGRVHVPLRYLAESIGAEVIYGDFVLNDMKQVDIITSQEKASENLKNSNVRQWSNAICTFIRLNGKVYESGLSDGISEEKKAAIVDSFKMVGIENRESLLSAVDLRDLGNTGNSEFVLIAMLQQIGVTELGYTEQEAAYMLPYTKILLDKWQEKGIRAFDRFVVIQMVDAGYVAGFLTEREAIQLTSVYAEVLQHEFGNWDNAVENYLDGFAWNAKIDVREKDTVYVKMKKRYEEMKSADASPFQEELFAQQIEG